MIITLFLVEALVVVGTYFMLFLFSTGGMGPGMNGMAGSPGPGNPYGLQVKL